MHKDFDGWNHLKQKIDIKNNSIPLFQPREIWWCSVGVNVGYEVFGKKELFTRPVLILQKYSKYTFFGLPLSSKIKETYYRFPIYFKDIHGEVLLDQGKTFDVKRLVDKMGRIKSYQLEAIKKAFKDVL